MATASCRSTLVAEKYLLEDLIASVIADALVFPIRPAASGL
jgi:hypothetical protein